MVEDLTLFTTCKPFEGLVGVHQENALRSWSRLGLPILLLGDEPGTRKIADELGIKRVVDIERNDNGLPMVSSLFSVARANSATQYLAYLNADIILLPDFYNLVLAVQSLKSDEHFLAVSRRRNIPLNCSINFKDDVCYETLEALAHEQGSWDHPYAIDLFLFSRDLYDKIPDFSIGRPMWDNWMLSEAQRLGAKVIDGSGQLNLLHPIHGYGGEWADVTHGDDARRNRKLGPHTACNIEDSSTHFVTQKFAVEELTAQIRLDRQQAFEPDNGKELEAFTAYLAKVDFLSKPQGLDDIKAMLWRWQRYFPIQDALQPKPVALPQLLEKVVVLCRKAKHETALDVLQNYVAELLVRKVLTEITKGRAVYIWGAGQHGQRLYQMLGRNNVEVTGFVDKNHKLRKHKDFPVQVGPISLLTDTSPVQPFVIIGTMYFKEVISELEALGFDEDSYVF